MADLHSSFKWSYIFNATVIVAALGYFVDVYDLLLFSIVRVESLRDLGITSAEDIDTQGGLLLNWQMAGLIAGGIMWGMLGDKKGRLTVLFGSIITYSVANFLNGFVVTIEQYALLRFLAGIGLAGELGAGITLVTEKLPRESRGYGTMVVASVGVMGAVAAVLVTKIEGVDWRMSYFTGGGLGFMLLLLRIKVSESGMFKSATEQEGVRKGSLRHLLLGSPERTFRYLKCIVVGMPVWFTVGILITFASTFAKKMGVTAEIDNATCIMWNYIGLMVGDLMSGVLSQWFKSRIKPLLVFFTGSLLINAVYLMQGAGSSPEYYYFLCTLMGFFVGYWAVLVTLSAEQFGTNLRATVATSVPNLIRGSLIPMNLTFLALKGSMGEVAAAMAVGAVVYALAYAAALLLQDTFSKELDYHE